jgi:hypothetical protein
MCCITCQKLKVVEVEEVQEDSDPECDSDHDADLYGSLDGGSPRNFSGDEVVQKGKEGNKNGVEDGDDPEPRPPNLDIKSAKRARISRIVIYQVRVTYGVRQIKILEAIVTPNVQPAGYVVVCVLFIMFCEYMFCCYLFPFILMFSTSSMFELHVVVAGIIMFNILELIMEIVPNYPIGGISSNLIRMVMKAIFT